MISKLKNIGIAFVFLFIWILLVIFGMNKLSEHYKLSVFIYGVIIAPIWEELAFRKGPIDFARKLNPDLVIPIVIMSSFLFGWAHGNEIGSILKQGVMGFVFSWVYIKNKYSYWSSVFIHALWNFFVYAWFSDFYIKIFG